MGFAEDALVAHAAAQAAADEAALRRSFELPASEV